MAGRTGWIPELAGLFPIARAIPENRGAEYDTMLNRSTRAEWNVQEEGSCMRDVLAALPPAH